MNQLSLEKRTQIITLLVEGNSLRSTSRISGCSINTVTKLLVDVGIACQSFHSDFVKDVQSKCVQCDETWAFVYAKDKNVTEDMKESSGDVWTWVGIDADSKLVISWYVGDRSAVSAYEFMSDVASRVSSRIQLSIDGHRACLEAFEGASESRVDYAQLVKMYGGTDTKNEKRYIPAECTGTKKNIIVGNPDMKHVSTSYVERQNLTIRMGIRRLTRMTNAFSKKYDNHCHVIALHFVYYNFVRIHKSLMITPAMEAGLTKKLWNVSDIVRLTDLYS